MLVIQDMISNMHGLLKMDKPFIPYINARATFHIIASIGLIASLAACSSGPSRSVKKGKYDPNYGVSASARVATAKGEFRKGGGHYKIGKPYKVAGKTYRPKLVANYDKKGKASWYGDDFHGRLTANGEIFDMNTLMAAHPTMPLPSYARVTNLKNGSSVIVRVNDRGPYAHGRIIDMSKRAAILLGFKHDGITDVRVQYVGRARMDGKDDRFLEASYRRKGQPIGNDRKAIPTDGRQVAPEIMLASAKPAKKPKGTYLLAHVGNPARSSASRSTIAMANKVPDLFLPAPDAGWAPIDLTGEGYFPPADLAEHYGGAQLAQAAPITLYYTQPSSKRISAGHAAIHDLLAAKAPSRLTQALRKKAAARSASRAELGKFKTKTAHSIAESFAHLAAVDMIRQRDQTVLLRIHALKPGVRWSDIKNLKSRLNL